MAETRLFLPFLARFYRTLEPCAYAAMRISSGAMMATFGYAKLFVGGIGRDIAEFQHLGLEPAAPLAYFTSGLEFFGGLMIAVGFLTRPIAALFVGELLVILTVVMIPRGTGFQLTVVWLGVFLLVLMRGGDKLSIDRRLGREF
jgi:putative oxidoreductase